MFLNLSLRYLSFIYLKQIMIHYFITCSIVLFFISCSGAKDKTDERGDTRVPQETALQLIPDGDHCYTYTGMSDTMILKLKVRNETFSGSLDQMNNAGVKSGIIDGVIKSDTLFATQRMLKNEEMVFSSAIFLIADSLLKQASGEMIQDEDAKWVFKDHSALNFKDARIFHKSICGN